MKILPCSFFRIPLIILLNLFDFSNVNIFWKFLIVKYIDAQNNLGRWIRFTKAIGVGCSL